MQIFSLLNLSKLVKLKLFFTFCKLPPKQPFSVEAKPSKFTQEIELIIYF